MAKEDIDEQVRNISVKLRERDEMAAKNAEKEWREAMAKDTAGTVMGALQQLQLQVTNLQAQMDATNPLAPILRSINMVVAKITEMDGRLIALEKKGAGE